MANGYYIEYIETYLHINMLFVKVSMALGGSLVCPLFPVFRFRTYRIVLGCKNEQILQLNSVDLYTDQFGKHSCE